MSGWSDYERQVKIKFRTPAPSDAPEIKGYRCYFQPEWLEWEVTPQGVRVGAFGPATRTSSFPGEYWWWAGHHGVDDRPSWLTLPVSLIAAANLAVEDLERKRKEATHD